MELVYLWVEDYKNIKKQGFNFSPRFECEFEDKYDENGKLEDNCELVITPKEHLKNFFGDNINVTAIVGENGSGKSSLLEFLCIFFKIDISFLQKGIEINKLNKNLPKEFLIIFYDGLNYKVINTTNIKIINKFEPLDLSKLSFFTNNDFGRNKYNPIYKNEKFYVNNKFISNVINFIKNENKFYETFYFNPTSIYLSVYNSTSSDLLEKIAIQINNEYANAESKLNYKPDELKKENEKSLRYLVENKNILDSVFIGTKDDSLHKFNKDYNINDRDVIKFIEFLNKFGLIEIYDATKSFYSNNKQNVGLNFNELSTGEKDNIKLLLDIYSYVKTNKNSTKLFFLDEPNNSYHPNWQKEYINNLLEFITYYSCQKNYLYITTHSPFILSDLPKENIIFLKKDKLNGNCKNVSKDIEMQTFGANIHTLLSHGFFMDGGLMGEFAKNTIDDIIKNLKDEKFNPTMEEKEKVLATVRIIGEDFLRVKLLDMYYKKFNDDLTKRQRKEELQKQKDNIEKELKQYD